MESSGGSCKDEGKNALTDTNFSHSPVEKDSGLSRMTDSDLELLPTPIPSSLNHSTDSLADLSGERNLKRSASESSLERELASLHHEMETIRLECDRLILRHNDNERGSAAQMTEVGINGQNMHKARSDDLKRRTEDTSSAYNTGESCRSTPLKSDAFVYNKIGDTNPRYPLLNGSTANKTRCMASQKPSTSRIPQVKFRLPQYSVVLRENGKNMHGSVNGRGGSEGMMVNERRRWLTAQITKDVKMPRSNKAGITMYTKPQKIAETIALQQRLLREAVAEQAYMLRTSAKSGSGSNCEGSVRAGTATGQFQDYKTGETCEWKIKRRSDGTRYITKRPIRNKLLKEREEQLNKERTGLSTDDDAMSELKTGRFWTREERKKQWERAKQHKMKHHQLMAQQNQQPSDHLIVQLSRKKMMRRKGNPLLDKFTTIQEFLAHANRDISTRSIDGILSVTTV